MSRSGSAITMLNAIKSNHGAALGIDADISVMITASDELEINTGSEDNLLVKACIDVFEEQSTITVSNIEIQTHSTLPSQRGMKTSSAISCCLVEGLATYYDVSLGPHEIIQLAVKASIDAGVSITGALDDAYAAYLGGLSYTQTSNRSLLSHQHIPSALLPYNVLLLIPQTSNPKTSLPLESVDMRLIEKAHDKFIKEEYIDAITYNTQAYAPHLLRRPDIIEELGSFGMVGLNGAGPSLFMLEKRETSIQTMQNIKNSFDEFDVVHTQLRDRLSSIPPH
ncbi:MAG: shikimate kinase [Candidatus Heimdallarchaeota archaeon]|nr:shikimate kinase [Candidatus Heimdallarchaeota archaeon]